MKHVLVVGAGAQGGPCASILAGEKTVEEITLGDINLELAQKVAEKIGSKKVHPIQLDASNLEDLVAAAEGTDIIMNFTLIKYNYKVMEAALKANAHYVDTACSTEFLQHWISGEEPKFHQEFKDIGKTCLVGCGFAPGVANMMTRYICDQMDTVDKILIRVARGGAKDSGEVVSPWKPTWSPEILLEDYAEAPMIFEDGKFKEIPIFSNPETFRFADPVGKVLISSHSHEETYLIPKFYVDKGLKHLDFKYPVDKLVGAFIKMGFANDKPIDVKGVKVVPRDVLMTLVQRPGNKFFEENEKTILQAELTGVLNVEVEGEKDGKRYAHTVSYKFTDEPNKEHQRKLYQAYGTTMVYVALPALVGAKMCMQGEVENGVVPPDILDPEKFMDGMGERSVPFEFTEWEVEL